MNTRRCLKIADRMHELLLCELGQGADGLRMVAEPLYARDVLLVCDAMPGTELALLAQQYRVAATERQETDAPPSRPPASRVSGFASSIGSRIGQGFGLSSQGCGSSLDPDATPEDADVRLRRQARRWFSPSRWLAGK